MQEPDLRAVFLLEGKSFHGEVDKEKGNFDYLMGCNLDIANPNVRKELLYWGEWYTDTTNGRSISVWIPADQRA